MIIDSLKELDKIKSDLTIEEIFFQDVVYRRHINPDGSVGGFVAETAKVEKTCFIEFSALVCDNAKIYGTATICGNAKVYDDKINYLVKTITFGGFTLSFTKNYVFAGCKFKWRISDIDKIKYKEVKEYISKKQFLYLKKIIKLMINYEKV